MLNELTDIQLINNVKEKRCSDSLIELRNRHEGIVAYMVKRYAGSVANCSGISSEDLMSEKDMLIYKAALDFEESKNVKFVTWLGNKTRFFCLNTIHNSGKYYSQDPDTMTYIMDAEHNSEDNSKNKMIENSDYILNLADEIKDKRIKRIVKLRYFSDKKKDRSFKHIAKQLSMSTQGVINLHDSFISFVQKKSKSINHMDTL